MFCEFLIDTIITKIKSRFKIIKSIPTNTLFSPVDYLKTLQLNFSLYLTILNVSIKQPQKIKQTIRHSFG